MEYKIIGISGKKNSGKDTLQRFIKDELHFVYRQRTTSVAFADPIKKAAMIMFPNIDPADLFGDSARRSKVVEGHINPETGEPLTIRDILLQVGKWGRDTHPDTWIRATLPDIRNGLSASNVIAVDIRFPNEKQIIESMGGKVVRIVRPGFESDSKDASEVSFDSGEHPFYKIITNDTLENLSMQASLLVADIFK